MFWVEEGEMQELNKIFEEKEKAKRFSYDEKRRVVYGQWRYLHHLCDPKRRQRDTYGAGGSFQSLQTFLHLLRSLTSRYHTLMDHCGLRQHRCQWCP